VDRPATIPNRPIGLAAWVAYVASATSAMLAGATHRPILALVLGAVALAMLVAILRVAATQTYSTDGPRLTAGLFACFGVLLSLYSARAMFEGTSGAMGDAACFAIGLVMATIGGYSLWAWRP